MKVHQRSTSGPVVNRVVERGMSCPNQSVGDASGDVEMAASWSPPHDLSDSFEEANDLLEPSFYSVNQKVASAAWNSMRMNFLRAMTEIEGMSEGQLCTACESLPASFRCLQCGPLSYFCFNCLSKSHTSQSMRVFHVPEQWKVRVFHTCV